MFRADLHTHTHYSDGELTPQQLLHSAKRQGLSALSITDHDTVAGIAEAQLIAEQLGIELLAGVEFTTTFEGKGVHLLGYGIAIADPALQRFCKRHQQRRIERFFRIVDALKKQGVSLDPEKLLATAAPTEAVGRRHLARAIVAVGRASSLKEAFIRYLRACSGEHAEELPCLEETVSTIHAAGGIAVVAHPHLFSGGVPFVKKILLFPIDGIECYYARMQRHHAEEWVSFCKEHRLLVTGGSDCHSLAPGEVQVGSSWIDATHLLAVKQRLAALAADS